VVNGKGHYAQLIVFSVARNTLKNLTEFFHLLLLSPLPVFTCTAAATTTTATAATATTTTTTTSSSSGSSSSSSNTLTVGYVIQTNAEL
jgi:hypothetical protein